MGAKAGSKAAVAAPFPAQEHDHGHCAASAMDRAAAICAARGARLTDLRRRVLELVWTSHRPVGAYDILAQLGGPERPAGPPTVYRALDFLQENGLVHRIASLNAYIGCPDPGHAFAPGIMICEECGRAAELHDTAADNALSRAAAAAGFTIARRTIEMVGRCRDCAAKAA